ncbi:MAG TPA: signal recognition particle-docking protein FtsY [Planctomycetota bacterium]
MALGDFFKRAKQTVVGLAKKASESLVAGVQKTAKVFRSGLDFLKGRKLDEENTEKLRDVLITADVSPSMADQLVEKAREAFKDHVIESTDEVLKFLKDAIKADFPPQESACRWAPAGEPTVILVVGVNGSGKTTSIAKLAHRFKNEGKSVLLAPADTFRAAAVEQLVTWANRVGVDYVPAKQNQDAASVAHQAVERAVARKNDVVIVDTAGRLDNKKNLMDELEKITRVIRKKLAGAPHEVLLVLDGNTGQTAVRQAKNFEHTAGVTGLIITKLDGTAKGGAVISMRAEVDIPVKWIGLGEKMTDLEPFDADVFVDEIFKTENAE